MVQKAVSLYLKIFGTGTKRVLVESLDANFAKKLLELVGVSEKSEVQNTLSLFKDSLLKI